MLVIAFFHSSFSGPAVVLNLPEEHIILHHARTTWLMMIEVYKTSVTEFGLEIRNVLRNNVGMYVNSENILHASK